MTDTATAMGRCGHAWGGPTWVVARPDSRVVVRMAFTSAEVEVDASGLDEVLGLLLGDGSVRVTAAASLRRLAWGATTTDGTSRLFSYTGTRQQWQGQDCPVWGVG